MIDLLKSLLLEDFITVTLFLDLIIEPTDFPDSDEVEQVVHTSVVNLREVCELKKIGFVYIIIWVYGNSLWRLPLDLNCLVKRLVADVAFDLFVDAGFGF